MSFSSPFSTFYFRISIFRVQGGDELASGKLFQSAEPSGEFGRGQAPLAVQYAQKIRRRTVARFRVAFETAGDQIALRIASAGHARHDVLDAFHVRGAIEGVPPSMKASPRNRRKLSLIVAYNR
jgi:hypothetical protein